MMSDSDRTLPHMSGYLLKQTSSGKWQKRWFETNSQFLTYYKSPKMEKLLAALNLPQVGEIRLADNGADFDTESTFTIELNTRTYRMKAESRKDATKWVRVLRRLQNTEVVKGKRIESPLTNLLDEEERLDAVNSSYSKWEKHRGCFGCFR
mmetsp:Transcript_14909/g.21154  ORF Transcript_14909/g.21154 Transcript_14909/m.21154 type:complete len:151 (-) Transcript_14909:131-583(-)